MECIAPRLAAFIHIDISPTCHLIHPMTPKTTIIPES
jgi:hypothetical protein